MARTFAWSMSRPMAQGDPVVFVQPLVPASWVMNAGGGVPGEGDDGAAGNPAGGVQVGVVRAHHDGVHSVKPGHLGAGPAGARRADAAGGAGELGEHAGAGVSREDVDRTVR